MIELKREFKKKDIEFKQLYKDNSLVIYGLSTENANHDGKTTWYEIFKYRVKEQDKFHQDEYEAYPSSEEFGTWAWSCSTPKSLEKILKREFPMEDSTEMLRICWGVQPLSAFLP